jgi:hypothetical protein
MHPQGRVPEARYEQRYSVELGMPMKVVIAA